MTEMYDGDVRRMSQVTTLDSGGMQVGTTELTMTWEVWGWPHAFQPKEVALWKSVGQGATSGWRRDAD